MRTVVACLCALSLLACEQCNTYIRVSCAHNPLPCTCANASPLDMQYAGSLLMDACGRIGAWRGFKTRLQWLLKGVCPSPLFDPEDYDGSTSTDVRSPGFVIFQIFHAMISEFSVGWCLLHAHSAHCAVEEQSWILEDNHAQTQGQPARSGGQ